jgi:hypothetical protein
LRAHGKKERLALLDRDGLRLIDSEGCRGYLGDDGGGWSYSEWQHLALPRLTRFRDRAEFCRFARYDESAAIALDFECVRKRILGRRTGSFGRKRTLGT